MPPIAANTLLLSFHIRIDVNLNPLFPTVERSGRLAHPAIHIGVCLLSTLITCIYVK